MIVEDTNIDRPVMTLMLECRKTLLEFKKVKIRHIYGEANVVADALPMGAVDIEHHFLMLQNLPKDVWKFIYFDGAGKNSF